MQGLTYKNGHKVGVVLHGGLNALNDLQPTLKHAHWNVVGRNSIGVHQMLDPHIELVLAMVDETAERMTTLGISPKGLPGALVQARDWDDYSIGRAAATAHLAVLDILFDGVISSH